MDGRPIYELFADLMPWNPADPGRNRAFGDPEIAKQHMTACPKCHGGDRPLIHEY